MAKKSAAKVAAQERVDRPFGGSIFRVKRGGEFLAGLFGKIRRADGTYQQKQLVKDATDEAGAEAELAAWVLAERGPTASRDELRAFSEWLLDTAKSSPVAARFDALARKALGIVDELPKTPDGLRNVTTSAFAPEFLKTMGAVAPDGSFSGRVSREHYDDVEQRCNKFAEFAGDRAMSSIDAVVVADYLAKLAAAPGHGVKVPVLTKDGRPLMKDGKPVEEVRRDRLSPHAIRRHRSALSLLWKCAIDRRAASVNVWTGNAAKIAKGQEYVAVNLTADEVSRVLALVPEPVRPILTFCAETGVRLGEARALTWQQVGSDFGSFTVARAKSGRSRTLPTTAKASDVLEARWASHVAKTRGADLVFEDYSRSRIYVCFKSAVKTSGVDRRTRVHDLRHHVGTALANANVPIHVVMQALGHSRLQTVQRYTHSGADALTDAFRAMEAARGPVATTKAKRKAKTA